MTDTQERPSWDKPSWRLVNAPYPQPGPAKAEERLALKRARRPSLTTPRMKRVRQELLRKHGKEHWQGQLYKQRMRKSLKAFAWEALAVIEPGTQFVDNWHIDVICQALEDVSAGKIKRLLINVPPGHMKSFLVSVLWPAWVWLNDPSWRMLFCTYVESLSLQHAKLARALIESDWYQSLIPRCYGPKWDAPWKPDPANWNERSYGTDWHGLRFSTSITGAGTGFRGHCIVIDDPINITEYPTDEALAQVISWYNMRMSSRFADQDKGALVIIMQRTHDNDLSGYVLAQDALHKDNPSWIPYEHICLRSEYDPQRPNKYDRREKKGELLFPGKFGPAVIERARIQLGSQYSAQHQQDPAPPGGAIFPMLSLCFYYPSDGPVPPPHHEKDDKGNLMPCRQGPLPEAKHWHFEAQSWDCAFKDEDDNDYVAGGHFKRQHTRIYLIELVHGHLHVDATCKAIKAMRDRNPRAFAVYIEDKANGPAVIKILEKEVFGLVPVDPKGGKIARARACEPLIIAGNLWLPHPALYPWVHRVLNELRPFPRGNNDDIVDMITQALIQLAIDGGSMLENMARR